MSDIFYLFGFAFIILTIKDLFTLKKDFEENYNDYLKTKNGMWFAIKSIETGKQKDLVELHENKDQLKGVLNDNLDLLEKHTKPISFQNISSVIYHIWIISGLIFSYIWFLFLVEVLSIFIIQVYCLFTSISKNKLKTLSICNLIIRINVLLVITYLHFSHYLWLK